MTVLAANGLQGTDGVAVTSTTLAQTGDAPLDIFPADQGPGEEIPRLGGVRFWVMSLWSWLLLAVVAVVLTVRRISLPKAWETS